MAIHFIKIVTFVGLTLVFLSGCQQDDTHSSSLANADASVQTDAYPLTVFKTPTCGCCTKWLDHLAQSGIPNHGENLSSLAQLKSDKKIQPKYRSCHTGVSKNGYVFEGHVPAKYIKQFLDNPPDNAIGLSVPAMPIGSPGMEVDDGHGGSKFMPYQVLLLKQDGTAEIYADVTRYSSQF